MAESSFQLIDLSSDIAFTFQYFPEEIRLSGRANWEPQNTTIGTKPLFYANTEPWRLSVDDLYLDNTNTNRSLKADLEDLILLKAEVSGQGSPPKLLVIWGNNNRLRCVLTDLNIEEIMFNNDGDCIRARIGVELLQVQADGESTTVTVQPGV